MLSIIDRLLFFLRSYAAVTFSVPADTFVTIEGDYWVRSLKSELLTHSEDGKKYFFVYCDYDNQDMGLTAPYCSPSWAVVQGELDPQFYKNDNVLQTSKPKKIGWSSFNTSLKTLPNSSYITLYLKQEWQGPLSSSYFANLKIRRGASESTQLAATALSAEDPLKIDCNLTGWKMFNSILNCGVSHQGRNNVIELSNDGEW